jgi:hypothetical protein
MSDEREQQYGGITDPDALAWLQRNYPRKPEPQKDPEPLKERK